MMRSSYLNNLNYGDIISALTFMVKPKKIVEIGLLDGYSLSCFLNSRNKNEIPIIEGYDIFDEFNGNHASYEKLSEMFKNNKNVKIQYGDFYNLHKSFEDNSIDILHIDIANNGEIFKYAIENYYRKINSIMILEGGSIERDNVEWMIKYEKPKINSYLESIKNEIDYSIIGSFPSITVVKKHI